MNHLKIIIVKIELIKVIDKIINNSKKPVLCVGQGCNDNWEELREFANKGNIPVTTTIHHCRSI